MGNTDNPFLKNGKLDMNAEIGRIQIVDIPDTKIDWQVKGKLVRDVIYLESLIRLIKQNLKHLQLDSNKISDKQLPNCLVECLDSNILEVKLTAENIVRRFGRDLGYVLLVLKRGDKINQNTRKAWNKKQCDYWKSLETIILSGGLCSGNLGDRLKYYVDMVFEEANIPGYKINIANNSSIIPITGASRYIPSDAESALILDLGQTFIKRCLAFYNSGELMKLHKLPSVKSKFMQWGTENKEKEKEEAKSLNEYILNAILKTWKVAEKMGIKPCNTISISIANYVYGGQLVNRGGYGKLIFISDNYQDYISRRLSEILNKNIKVIFIHDGTAAATTFAETDNAVMLTLGTAIGIGFPVFNNNLRPISKDLIII